MKLNMIRLPMMGLPSAETRVTATDGDGRPLSDGEGVRASRTEVVLQHPEEATALLTGEDGRRFERPVRAIVTGPLQEHEHGGKTTGTE